jgi:hypothetical protein
MTIQLTPVEPLPADPDPPPIMPEPAPDPDQPVVPNPDAVGAPRSQ